MADFLPFNTSFVLDKSHLSECFEQSAVKTSAKNYLKTAAFAVAGLVGLAMPLDNYYIGYFVVGLAVVEGLSVYYKKTWWLWRQMLSKAYDNKIELKITTKGVITSSFHVNSELKWDELDSILQTEQGFLLKHSAGSNYLSNSYLSDQVIDFIANKATQEQGDV